jgi:tetratricopeptide (TPR) repeat protein
MVRKVSFCQILVALILCFAFTRPACAGDPSGNWIEVRSPHFTVLCNAGERQGRDVASQFEEIRALFQALFPKFRVDFGRPTTIFALKNEDSLKLFLPSYGLNSKENHLGGLYHPGPDKNFALVRTDITGKGAFAYHALYHEYTHALLRLNFRGLPLWLEEGLAEYYGNTEFENKQAIFGSIDPRQLQILQHAPLIPISTLITADYTSPFYNGQEHSGIFYAESWALVHYFSVSPEVRKQHLLDKFLLNLQQMDDPVDAANQSFGDLNKLASKLEAYAHQNSYLQERVPLQAKVSEKEFEVRKIEPAEMQVEQADFLLTTGHREDGLRVLHEAEARNTKLSGVHDGLGYYHYLRSALDEADAEYQEALDLDPNDAIALFYRARILLNRNGYNGQTTSQIRTYLERATGISPDFAQAHAFLSMTYTEAPETRAKAITEAQLAIALEPGNLAYFIDLGRALLRNGKIAEAKQISERAQKMASTGGDRAIAASFAKQLTEPTNIDDFRNLYVDAGEAFSRGDYATAVMLLRKVTSIAPQSGSAWNGLGRALLAMNQLDAAAQAFGTSIDKDPTSREAYNNLGLVYWRQRKYAEAAAQLRKQILVNSNDHYAHRNLAMMLLDQHQCSDAMPEFQKALSLTPNHAPTLLAEGQCDLDLGNRAKGISELEQAINLSSEPNIFNSAAYALANRNIEISMAEKWADTCLTIESARPHNSSLDHLTPEQLNYASVMAAYWDTRGWIYYLQGDNNHARSYLEAAWSLRVEPTTGYHLGRIYEKLGRSEDATKAYAMAVASADLPTSAKINVDDVADAKKQLTKLAESDADIRVKQARVDLSSRSVMLVPNEGALSASGDFAVRLSAVAKAMEFRQLNGDKALARFADSLQAAKLPVSIPESSNVELPLRATLTCHSEQAQCRFAFFSPEDAANLARNEMANSTAK